MAWNFKGIKRLSLSHRVQVTKKPDAVDDKMVKETKQNIETGFAHLSTLVDEVLESLSEGHEKRTED